VEEKNAAAAFLSLSAANYLSKALYFCIADKIERSIKTHRTITF
jgi:hypothetical protein